jgi:hypothetical protein
LQMDPYIVETFTKQSMVSELFNAVLNWLINV